MSPYLPNPTEFCCTSVLPLTVTSQRPDPNTDCSICCENLDTTTPTASIVVLTPCSHFFHTTCISSWMNSTNRSRGTCPNCRRDLFESEPMGLAEFASFIGYPTQSLPSANHGRPNGQTSQGTYAQYRQRRRGLATATSLFSSSHSRNENRASRNGNRASRNGDFDVPSQNADLLRRRYEHETSDYALSQAIQARLSSIMSSVRNRNNTGATTTNSLGNGRSGTFDHRIPATAASTEHANAPHTTRARPFDSWIDFHNWLNPTMRTEEIFPPGPRITHYQNPEGAAMIQATEDLGVAVAQLLAMLPPDRR